MSVTIAAEAIAAMLAHARDEAPNECCGLLIGRRDTVERVVRARNLHASPTRFLINPEDHFAAIRAARAEQRHVIGAYHSHPSSAAAPSPSDIAEASGGRNFLYVVISLLDDRTAAYFVRNGEAASAEIDIAEPREG